jgi:two-component system sensor kinase FixL
MADAKTRRGKCARKGMGVARELHKASSGADSILSQMIEIVRSTALAEMASGIAHELNQPLAAAATFAQAGQRMLNRPEPMVAQALDVFRQINQEALNAGEGLRRIRRLFEQDQAATKPCQMSILIDELQPVFEWLAARTHGTLRVEATLSEPAVECDRTRIQLVLFALVQNAFEASIVNGPPEVRISVTNDRYSVETNIFDSGPGVPRDADSQIFRPFFTTKRRGTGLGLASSRAIVEAHEGTIGFENLSVSGCRFWFRLPVAGA